MRNNLINADIKRMRYRYDEALELQGIPCQYQYPSMAGTNNEGEALSDTLSVKQDTHIFFDGNPKVKTYKRLGWVVENDKDLPFLIHCSFHLPNVQRDSIFTFGGQYTELKERSFRVIEITYDIQAPDHIVCQVIPVYDDKPVGSTKKEVEKRFNKSNHFLQQPTDYRGNSRTELPGDR